MKPEIKAYVFDEAMTALDEDGVTTLDISENFVVVVTQSPRWIVTTIIEKQTGIVIGSTTKVVRKSRGKLPNSGEGGSV
jgi:hypothetical protein